jgi:hypothetical protein
MRIWGALAVAALMAGPAHAMPNDPDVIGLAVAQAVLLDAAAEFDGCVVPKLAPSVPPSGDAHMGWGNPKPVPRAQADALDAAYRAAQAIPDDIVDADQLHAILPKARFDDGSSACKSRLTLSLPRVAGDWAFVETAHKCGVRCGWGAVVAYQRRAGRWRRVAVAGTWIN